MFTIEGRKCVRYSTSRAIKKKAVQISLFIDQQMGARRIENTTRFGRMHTGFNEGNFAKEKYFKGNTPDGCSPVFTPKDVSKTSTPLKARPLLSVHNYVFKPPENTQNLSTIFHDELREERKQQINCRKALKSQEVYERNPQIARGNGNKITLRDFNLNLPTIIKSSRYKKKNI